ncbi:MAG TPA: alpha/beta hydrolase [Cyclobacteriaceae bacterium]|jgi:pimeloyl-ACP methyl ester carboxylesterase|nr:alpha/beta hydrolase [Cyclobacteriaceae bacterium]
MKNLSFSLLLILISQITWSQITDPSLQTDFYTSSDGTKIYYEVKGNGDAVVLVHGFVVNGESWKKTALYNDLLSAGYKVITMDLRGNGKSDKPHNPELYLHDVEAKDVMGIVSKLGIQKYSVVGYSRGAIIASRLLVLDERVTHAVIGGMGADFTNPQWPRRVMFYEALSGKKAAPEVEGLIKHIKEAGLDQEALAYMQYGQPSTSKEELAKVKKPVQVICGTEDTDNGSAKELAALIPTSIYSTVPGDHGGAVRTLEFSASVISFIKK